MIETNDGTIASRLNLISNQACEINFSVKRRNGKPKYWCVTHRAPAWDDEGNLLSKCAKADLPLIPDHQVLELNLQDYPGGIAVWGGLPAIYDTHGKGYDKGIHVHARREVNGKKVIDRTYKTVKVKDPTFLFDKVIEISEDAAVSYVASVIFGIDLKYLACSHCGEIHHDADFFAVNKHKKHLCGSCGREFFDIEPSVSNPTMVVKNLLGDKNTQRPVIRPNRPLKISQKDCPKGIQIWASNLAVIWTSPSHEEVGIHIHGYDERGKRIIDDTFDSVEIDGLILDEMQARFYMAQMSLPYLSEQVCSISCPVCDNLHFDVDTPVTPHSQHQCESCGNTFNSPNNNKVVSNPFVRTLEILKENQEILKSEQIKL